MSQGSQRRSASEAESSDLVHWDLYPGQHDDPDKAIRPSSNSVKRIDDLDEIEFNPKDYRPLSFEGLAQIHFRRPHDDSSAYDFIVSCISLVEFCKKMSAALSSDSRILSEEEIEVLQKVQDELLGCFTLPYSPFFYEPFIFTLNHSDHADALFLQGFVALLWCVRCWFCNKATRISYGKVTIQLQSFAELAQSPAFPSELKNEPLCLLNAGSLLFACQKLELCWNEISPIPQLDNYLLLLLISASQLIRNDLPASFFGNRADYRLSTGPSVFTASQSLLEEICWSLTSMYQRYAIYEELSEKLWPTTPYNPKRAVLPRPLHNTLLALTPSPLTKPQRAALTNYICEGFKKISDNSVERMFMDACLESLLYPSEMSRYCKTATKADRNPAAVLRAMRSKELVKNIFERLSNTPVNILQHKLFGKVEREILIAIGLQVCISNLIDAELDWLNLFVHFRTELAKEVYPKDFLNRSYPVMVQYFKDFGIFWKNCLYPHNYLLDAFMHWLGIMLKPPFSGFYDNIDLRPLKKFQTVVNNL